MKRVAVAVLAVAAVILPVVPAGAGGGMHCSPDVPHAERARGSSAIVAMKDGCFTPTVLYVEPGTEVTFVNRDRFRHNLAGPKNTFVEGLYEDMDHGRRLSFVLEDEGVFPYMCYLHPGMAGAVVVGAGATGADLPIADAGLTQAGAVPPAGGSSVTPWAVALGIAMVLLVAAVAALAGRIRSPVAS